MEISSFVVTGYFKPSSPPQVTGSIVGMLYQHAGIGDWTTLPETPPSVPRDTAIPLAVQWVNQSPEPLCGHVSLVVIKPSGAKVNLSDVSYQNSWASPGNGHTVQFNPITLDQVGTYQAEVVLSTMGTTLESKTITVVEVAPPVLELNAISGRQDHVLTVLDVEGIPFSSVGMEPKCSVAAFAQYLEETWGAGADSDARWVNDAQALAEAVSQITDVCAPNPYGDNQELIDAINQFPEYLTPDPYHNHANTIVAFWGPQEGTIPIATLSSPVTLNRLRGVNITCKTFTSYGYWDEQIPNRWWENIYCIMFFEPQFYPPKPPPGFRYIGDAPIAGETIELGPWSCFGGGHYYPGIYNAFVDIKMTGHGNPAAPVVEFRIKNAVKVTGSGAISP